MKDVTMAFSLNRLLRNQTAAEGSTGKTTTGKGKYSCLSESEKTNLSISQSCPNTFHNPGRCVHHTQIHKRKKTGTTNPLTNKNKLNRSGNDCQASRKCFIVNRSEVKKQNKSMSHILED